MPKRLVARPHDFHSLFLRLEELIVASSGADVFDEACRLAARKLFDETHNQAILEIVKDADRSALDPAIFAQCTALLAPFTLSQSGDALDALFETLMTRTSKGQKGQFFTPRYVVNFCVALAAPAPHELVLDPACGSGAFLSSALNYGVRGVQGLDIDARAVRVARLLLAASGADPFYITEADALRTLPENCADVILTNPPFAGDIVDADLLSGYELARGRDRIERDILFLERTLRALRPGGKLAIILPHSKFAGSASRYVREWLFKHAQVLAVIGLGRNTFLPHTHQKANVLLAVRRTTPRNGKPEPIFFAQSRHDGKTTRGRLTGSHDLAQILQQYMRHALESHVQANPKLVEGSRRSAQLDKNLTLAPERHESASAPSDGAVRIGDVAKMTSSYTRPLDRGPFVVIDTTHATDGLVSMRALQPIGTIRSSKKRLQPGDVIVSRLRPYLRQVALIDSALFERFPGAQVCCSTEFYVLRSQESRSLAFLVPLLLSPAVQESLARSQEGGHHPRVPATTLQGIPLHSGITDARDVLSADFEAMVKSFRGAEEARERLVARAESASVDL